VERDLSNTFGLAVAVGLAVGVALGVLVGVAVAVAVALGEIVSSAKNTATTNNPEISNAHEFGKADLEAALIFICSAASLFDGSPVQRYG
jgi:MFS superfamily sulfate permease-like transporter